MDMILSVAYFANDAEVKRAVLASDELRRNTLAKCYAIPGYSDMPLAAKNEVYDAIRREFTEVQSRNEIDAGRAKRAY